MKGKFVEFVRDLRNPVRARRQEKIREVELTWSDHDLSNFRVFAMGLPSAEMADVCYALADATAIPLLEVLVDYAEVNNDLLQIAFASLGRAPVSARLYLANALFSSKNAVVRAEACAMLGNVGGAASDLLVSALDDENTMVEAAAIRALMRIGHIEAGERILGRLRNPSEEIRSLALDAMIRLGAHAPDFAAEALEIFRNPSESAAIRHKAARAMSRMGSEDGRRLMLELLGDTGQDRELRAIAAEALGGFPVPEVVAALLDVVKGADPALAEVARQSIAGMSPSATLAILRQRVRGSDPAAAIVAAEILGTLKSIEAGQALAESLMTEKRIAVTAAIADSLGKSGFPGAWKVLYRKLRDDAPESTALLASLADAAREENIEEFAVLLDHLPESGAGEVVLRRLAAFSRTVKPSPTVLRRALDILDSGNRALSIPALEIMVYSGEEGIRDRALTEMACIGPEVPTRRLLRVMLKHIGGDMSMLFGGAGPETATLVADAAAEADMVGRDATAFFLKLAAWVRAETPGAREGLAAAARLDPLHLAEAMRKSPDRVFLLEAWSGLGERDRLRHFPDLDGLFAFCDARDRLLGLGFLAKLPEGRHLRTVAMLAFTDRDANVKAAAISLVRSLAGAGQ